MCQIASFGRPGKLEAFCGILFTSSKVIYFCSCFAFVLKEGDIVCLGLAVPTARKTLAHLHVISFPSFIGNHSLLAFKVLFEKNNTR